jgi:hypothetical protein
MHEDFSRPEEIHGSSDRTFGLVMAAFFAIVALAPLVLEGHGPVRWWALGLSALFLVLALAWPDGLAPLNRLWTGLGLLLNRIVSPVFLGLLYYLFVTPVGVLMRAFGNDPLRLRRDAAAASYWIPRNPPGPPPESMKNQF